MSEVVDQLMQRRIDSFDAFFRWFCDQRGIEKNMQTFLTFKSNPAQYGSDVYASLYRAPIELLVSSKAFKKYYEGLDADFKHDLISESDYRRQYLTLSTQQSIQQVIKSYLKEDCVW
jgi:hypothetical protein